MQTSDAVRDPSVSGLAPLGSATDRAARQRPERQRAGVVPDQCLKARVKALAPL